MKHVVRITKGWVLFMIKALLRTGLLRGGVTEWDIDTPYKTNDIVKRSGAVYIAKQDSTGVDPATDITHTYWDILNKDAISIFEYDSDGDIMPIE